MDSTPKKILFAYSSPTLHHGSPRVLVDIISGLNREKFHPVLICPKNGELTDFVAQQGVEVAIFRWRSITKFNPHLYLKDVVFFWRFFQKENIQLLHMNEVGWRDSLVLAAWMWRVPILLHLHVNYDGPIKSNWNFRFASSVIVVADALKMAFTKNPDVHKKLVTVHNGLDICRFQGGQSIRADLGLPERSKVVGFVGQIVEAKGLKFLVAATKGVLKVHPDTVFLFVGRSVASEAGLVDELKEWAESEKIAHALRFLGPRTDIPDVMKSLDILVLPTLSEAFGKVILEGMGAGLPVVASAVGGIPEIIENGVNGLLVPAGDVQALEEAIIRLLDDPKLRCQIAAEGLHTVRERFSVQKQITEICAIYDELLNSP